MSKLPLSDVRILAIEQMQAMPYATQLLAHLGADVVKVEHPRHGDSGRASAPSIEDDDGSRVGATFLRNNLNKRSIAVDLKHPDGVALIKRILPEFDVVVENFKPGTAARLGLGYADLAPVHAPLVYVSVSGFGNLGETPYGDWPAYAVVAEAMGGLYEFRREPGRLPNIGVAGAMGDIGSGLYAAIGLLAALHEARRTGQGQHVDIAMFDAMVSMLDMVPFNPSIGITDNSLSAWPGICTAFAASDGLFVAQIGREHQWERFVSVIGKPEWSAASDARFDSREGWRDRLEDTIRPAVEAWAAKRSKREAAAVLAAEGIASGPCYGSTDLVDDPHVELHDMVLEVERPRAAAGGEAGKGPIQVSGNPIKLSHAVEAGARSQARRWPHLGEHTDSVLEAAGVDAEERARLRAAGVIAG